VDPVQALGAGRVAPQASTNTDPGQINKAAEGFEAIFMRQILHQFRSSVSVDGESSSMTGLYTEMFDDQLAEHLAKAGGLGLKDVIRAYLGRNGQ